MRGPHRITGSEADDHNDLWPGYGAIRVSERLHPYLNWRGLGLLATIGAILTAAIAVGAIVKRRRSSLRR